MATKPNAPPRATRSKAKEEPAIIPVVAPARTTRATSSRAASTSQAGAPPKTAARKPSANTSMALHKKEGVPKAASKKPPRVSPTVVEDGDKEPIKAYLRIRPQLGEDEPSATPYLKSLSSTAVQMSDPTTSRIRLNQTQQSTYTFTHVFPPDTQQPEFFTKTTLPLVDDLLAGRNGLVFTYGVTNSGKTYTIQGGSQLDTAGLLPRTLDVVFNSLDGLHSNAPYRPVRLASVEHAGDIMLQEAHTILSTTDETVIKSVFAEQDHGTQSSDSTTLKVDRNYEYSIWLSYCEVYNEKIFDLLSDSHDDDPTPAHTGLPRPAISKKLQRSTSTWQNLAALTNSSSSDVLLVKRKALALKSDPDGGKYVFGLREVHVRTAAEAKAVFRMGNINRRVFGTLANSASSRSHGIFTVKVLKVHKGARDDIDCVTSSRLSIVDLAGSERTKNTQNTGDRLKEAGSINKSLMVLGQCMEALRTNQKRQAASLAMPGRGIVDPTRLGIVPFRHSKLTEVFQDFFVGDRDGRAVMIVNVNPYDTGFDENSHVMKFAALAREVTTAVGTGVATTYLKRKTDFTAVANGKQQPEPIPHRRKVTISTGGAGGRKPKEAHLEIVEEDEDAGEEDLGEAINPLVDALFDEVEELRIQLFESEMRCAIIEAETREEVMKEMEERMMKMERVFARRLMNEVEQNEMKTDAKIDMLHQFGNFNGKARRSSGSLTAAEFYADESGEGEDLSAEIADVSMDSNHGDDRTTSESTDSVIDDDGECSAEESPSPSRAPKKQAKTLSKKVPDNSPECIGLRDEDMLIDKLDADETMTIGDDEEEEEYVSGEDDDDLDEDEEIHDGDDGDEDDEWNPSPEVSPSSRLPEPLAKSKATSKPKTVKMPTKSPTASPASRKAKASVASSSRPSRGLSKMQDQMDMLTLEDDDRDEEDSDSATVILSKKGQNPTSGAKQKRQLGKKPVMTAGEIDAAAAAQDEKVARILKNAPATRRSTRGSR